MKSKKQQNGKAKVEAVKEETVAVTVKAKDRKRQSTEPMQAVPTKIKKEEPVSSPVAKSKKRKNRKKNAAAAANAATRTPQTPKKVEGEGEGKEGVSIAYLKQWQEDRKNWKFQKIRQIWLNDNMLNNARITDDVFPTWLEYMAGSSDRQKKFVVKKATEALKELEAADSTVDADDVRYQRAKKVIQSLDVEEEEEEDAESSS